MKVVKFLPLNPIPIDCVPLNKIYGLRAQRERERERKREKERDRAIERV